jgi:hypothetical protein
LRAGRIMGIISKIIIESTPSAIYEVYTSIFIKVQEYLTCNKYSIPSLKEK